MHIQLDPVGGIAGDMFAAAVLDAWPELEPPLVAALERAGLDAIATVERIDHSDHALTGSRFAVHETSRGDGEPHVHDGDDRHGDGHRHDGHRPRPIGTTTAIGTAPVMTRRTSTTCIAISAPCSPPPASIPAFGPGPSTSSRGSPRRNRPCTECRSRT